MNVLIVEDEVQLARELEIFLTAANYICEITHNGKTASEKIAVNLYDFILLDLGLPDCDGLDLLKQVKIHNPEAACLILTARSEVNDRIKGLDLGADDYLPIRLKFGLKHTTLKLGEFEIDMNDRNISHNGTTVSTITKKEYDLIAYLIMHKNRTLTRPQLSEHIWGSVVNDDYDSNYIDVHIKNIRKKLSIYAQPDWLETVRGLGYKIKM
jgi:DNA-binding response OmpR family regulator